MRLLTVALMLFSVSAFAVCPDLSGKFAACRSTTGQTDGSTNMVITQSNTGPISTYLMTYTEAETNQRMSDVAVADGKDRTTVITDPDGTVYNQINNYKCIGNSLVLNSKLVMDGQIVAQVVSNIQKISNQLKVTTNGSIFGEPISDVLDCQ